MKFSLLIAAIIIGVASIFGLQQRKTLKLRTTEWEEIRTTALEKEISSDPKATFSTRQVGTQSNRAARDQAIADFAVDLAAFVKKMEEASSEEEAAMQEETGVFIDKLTSMSPADFKILLKALAADTSIEDEAKEELVMISIMMLGSDHPESALAILHESSEALGLDQSRQMLPAILSQYAAKDPNGAAAWVNANEEKLGKKPEKIKKMLINTAAQENFTAAMAMVEDLGLEKTNETLGKLASGIKVGEQDQFLKALKGNGSEGESELNALSLFAQSAFIKEDFTAATTWIESSDLSETDQDAIIRGLHFQSVENSPEEWLGWIGERANQNDFTNLATQQIISGWAQKNFVDAGEWLQSQQDGPAKTTAVKTYAETLAPHEPAAAAEWAGTLPESPERKKLLTTIHSTLQKIDPTAASALAEKHGLDVGAAE